MTTNSGYHDCPCVTCFEIAIGADDDGSPSLCHACDEAGCDGENDCCAERGDEWDGLTVEVYALPEAIAGGCGKTYANRDLEIGERLTVRYTDTACDYAECEREDGTEVRVFAASKYLREVRS